MDVRPGKQHFGRCGMKRLWALVDTLPPNRRPALLRGDVGYGNDAGGRILDECFGTYANYLVKYVQAYGKEGLRIAALTVQNEPNTDQFGMSPTCLWARRNDRRTVCSAFRGPDGSHVVVIACKPEKGDPFSPVQVQVKHRNRYLIVQALPGSLTTVTISR